MANPLDHRLRRLHSQKAAVLSTLASYGPSQLRFRPAPGSWSALEVLDHLEKTEHRILNAVTEAMHNPHKPPMGDRVKTTLLLGLFLLPSRVKVPRSASFVLPEDNLDLTEVGERWSATRLRLVNLVGAFPSHLLHEGVFRHPVGGWMTMRQTLGFLFVHITHHTYQLRRLERSYAAA